MKIIEARDEEPETTLGTHDVLCMIDVLENLHPDMSKEWFTALRKRVTALADIKGAITICAASVVVNDIERSRFMGADFDEIHRARLRSTISNELMKHISIRKDNIENFGERSLAEVGFINPERLNEILKGAK